MLIKKNDSEATEVTCVTKVQDNSNACSCVVQLKVKDESMYNSLVQCKLGVKEPHLLVQYCSESGTDISDMHDISRFWETEQSGGSTDAVCTR